MSTNQLYSSFSKEDKETDGLIMRLFSRRRKHWLMIIFCIVALILIMTFSKSPKAKGLIYEDPPRPRVTNRCFSSHRKKEVTFRADNIINPRFSYPINVPNACGNGNIEVVMPVHSSITNFVRRNMTRHIRQGMFAKNKWNKAVLLFFIGLPSDKLGNPELFQEQLQNESRQYGDIIQMSVNDTYRNIVHKALGVLQWINTYCNQSEFVIKMDDDVSVDPPLLLLALYKYRNFFSEFIIGELRTNRMPERSKKIKWHMPREEYPNSTYPPFVPGPVLGYPTTTAYLLYQQALRTKTIWLDDVFISGICSKILGIPVLNDPHFVDVHRPMKTFNFIYE